MEEKIILVNFTQGHGILVMKTSVNSMNNTSVFDKEPPPPDPVTLTVYYEIWEVFIFYCVNFLVYMERTCHFLQRNYFVVMYWGEGSFSSVTLMRLSLF